MLIVFCYINLVLYIIQPFSWLLMPRELNYIFLVPPLFYILLQGRWKSINRRVGVALMILLVGSFLFSKTWEDLYLILGKIFTCGVVSFVAYNFGQKRQFYLYFFVSVAVFIIGDSLYRYMCFTPRIIDLTVGSWAYKTDCTIPFSDSNASGIVIVQALLIFHLMKTFNHVPFFVWLICWSLFTLLAVLTASKAVVVAVILYLFLNLFEKLVTRPSTRVLFFVGFGTLMFLIIHRSVDLDPSFASKLTYFDNILNVLISDPLSILFGHGYITGMKVLAGDSEFSHLMPALLLGSIGIIGSIGYYWLMWFAYGRVSSTFVPIILINLISLSYFPPFFEYFIFLAFFYAGMATYFQRTQRFYKVRS